MITAYLSGITTYFEGEDIEIRFKVFKDEELLFKEAFYKEYQKPFLVNHVALIELLKKLEEYKGEEITVVINDASLYEQIRGTSTLENKKAKRKMMEVEKKLKKFGNTIDVKDVSNNKVELKKWIEILED